MNRVTESRHPSIEGHGDKNLTQATLESLGSAIVTGRYDRRAFPTEAEIAKAYGVSRSVTREAVKMLVAKGLVIPRRRHGTYVTSVASWNLFDTDVLRWTLERRFSIDLLRQFNQLRLGIEPEAAALAAEHADAKDLTAIQAALRAMINAERGEGDPLIADISFHVAILRATKNQFYCQLQNVVETALRASIRFTNTAKGQSANIPSHAAVSEAIAARMAPEAHEAMYTIIRDVLSLIRSQDVNLQLAKQSDLL